MKSQRKILFRIIFFLTVFFSYGINTFSNCIIQPYNIEFSKAMNAEENGLLSEIDSCNDDKVLQISKYGSIAEPFCLISISSNPLLIHNFSSSIWQPPEIF
jgi:hypothetical protein